MCLCHHLTIGAAYALRKDRTIYPFLCYHKRHKHLMKFHNFRDAYKSSAVKILTVGVGLGCAGLFPAVPALASGTPYGNGTYGSSTYNGTGTTATTPSPSPAASSTPTSTGGAASSSSSSAPSVTSGKSSSPKNNTSPTTAPSAPTTAQAGTQPVTIVTAASHSSHSNSKTEMLLGGGSLLVVVAVGLSVWMLVRRRRNRMSPWDGPPSVSA